VVPRQPLPPSTWTPTDKFRTMITNRKKTPTRATYPLPATCRDKKTDTINMRVPSPAGEPQCPHHTAHKPPPLEHKRATTANNNLTITHPPTPPTFNSMENTPRPSFATLTLQETIHIRPHASEHFPALPEILHPPSPSNTNWSRPITSLPKPTTYSTTNKHAYPHSLHHSKSKQTETTTIYEHGVEKAANPTAPGTESKRTTHTHQVLPCHIRTQPTPYGTENREGSHNATKVETLQVTQQHWTNTPCPWGSNNMVSIRITTTTINNMAPHDKYRQNS